VDACTIVSRRELARARAMAGTLREHHPDARLTVLLLDPGPRDDGELGVGDLEDARVLGPQDILEEQQAGLLLAANPPGALAMALLPHLARRVFEAGAQSLLYIGPGQRVLGPLEELRELVAAHPIVLVARVGADPSAIAAAFVGEGARGAFSRELLGLRAEALTGGLLAAWPRWFVDAGDDNGAEAVRAWLERAPALSEEVGVLRDAGYGLDRWTLEQRLHAEDGTEARRGGGGGGPELRVDGRPARTLDLGALDPRDPPALFDGNERARLSSAPALAQVVERHARELLAAGFESDAELPAPLARLADGLRLTPTIRAELVAAIVEGAVTRSPFTQAGRAQLYEFLNRPGERGQAAGLTRLHLAIWEARADLRTSYTHLDGPDGAGLAGWLCVHGAEQEGLVAELLPPTPETAFRDSNPHVHEREPRWGVNVAGFFTAELGVGEAARLLIAGLDAAGVPALPIQGDLMPSSRRGAQFAYSSPDEAAYPINIVCINGDGIPVFAREAGRSFFADRYTIALWWWEVGDPPPSWSEAYEFLDEVWVGSQHIYDAIAPAAAVPVVRMTLPVIEPEVAPRTRVQLGLPEQGFLFLYLHDYHSVAARKNPLGLIEAFRRAFEPGAGAKLVVKSINAAAWPDEHERVVLAAAGHPDIELIDVYMSAAEKNAVIAHCDCYVSLHRSEGFGLTAAEAMLLGKPVIATRYGGTLEFMNDANSYLVDWEGVRVGEDAHPYPADGVWAEPDLEQAAQLMRAVAADPERARDRGQLARRELLEKHSPAVAGAAMQRRLALIHERLGAEGARSLNLAHLPPSRDDELIAAKLGQPPRIDWGDGRTGHLSWRAHRPVADWVTAYIDHQRGIDIELHRAIARLDARLREVAATLQDQQQANHAETLAALRRLNQPRDDRC
jgi:glycosyltransferase involved in cell wall biosynthesis